MSNDTITSGEQLEQNDVGSCNDAGKNNVEDKIILKREIGIFSAIGLITGVIIGSGVFLAPVAIVRHCNSVGLSLLIWLISGLFSIMKSVCFVELGLLFPRAGGEYAYMREINGETMAFLNAYVNLFASRPCIVAMLSKITVDYFIDAFIPSCLLHPLVKNVLGVWLILTIVLINSMPMKHIIIIQNVLSYMKLSALTLIIITGVVHITKGNIENFKEPFKNSNYSISSIFVSVFIGIYCYDGWQCIYDLMEDIKNPKKVAPISTTVSILTAIVFFIGTNVTYFSTMSPDEMAISTSVALSFAKVTMGGFSRVIPLLVACSTVGALNAAIMRGSRMLFAQGRDGIFPSVLCMLNIKYRVPWLAAWLICLLACVYMFIFDVFQLFDYLNFTSFLFKTFLYGNIIILRYTRPNLHRPFKVNLLIPAIIVILVITMAVSGAILSPYHFMFSQIVVAMGLPLYAFVRYCNTHPDFLFDFKYKFNSTLQKLLLIVPPEN